MPSIHYLLGGSIFQYGTSTLRPELTSALHGLCHFLGGPPPAQSVSFSTPHYGSIAIVFHFTHQIIYIVGHVLQIGINTVYNAIGP